MRFLAILFLMMCLLVIFKNQISTCVLGIFLVGPLDKFHIAGFPLGFWFAQQGAIYIFIILIGAYCVLMPGK